MSNLSTGQGCRKAKRTRRRNNHVRPLGRVRVPARVYGSAIVPSSRITATAEEVAKYLVDDSAPKDAVVVDHGAESKAIVVRHQYGGRIAMVR